MEDSEQQKTETNEKLGHSLEENLHQSTELKNQVDMEMFQPEEQMQEQATSWRSSIKRRQGQRCRHF